MNAEEPKGRITTGFSLGGQSFDAELFSDVVRLKPTEIWHQKLALLKNNPNYPNFAQIEWRYSIQKQPYWSIDAAITAMLDLFEPRREQIVAFAQKYNCSLGLRCRIYGDETIIIYNIERATIERLAAFGCEFSFTIENELPVNS